MSALIYILFFSETHQMIQKIVIDPQNVGVDTLIVLLSVILSDPKLNIHFSVMAAQICINMARGTFFQLGNIADRFLLLFVRARYTN